MEISMTWFSVSLFRTSNPKLKRPLSALGWVGAPGLPRLVSIWGPWPWFWAGFAVPVVFFSGSNCAFFVVGFRSLWSDLCFWFSSQLCFFVVWFVVGVSQFVVRFVLLVFKSVVFFLWSGLCFFACKKRIITKPRPRPISSLWSGLWWEFPSLWSVLCFWISDQLCLFCGLVCGGSFAVCGPFCAPKDRVKLERRAQSRAQQKHN